MLPPTASDRHHQTACPALPATVIGVGIDTSRYGHYAAFLGADLQAAAAELEVVEAVEGYAKLRQRLADLVAKHGRVHFHVRLDAAGLYADNLLAFLASLRIDGAQFTLSCGDTQRNKNYRAAVYGHQKSDPVEARGLHPRRREVGWGVFGQGRTSRAAGGARAPSRHAGRPLPPTGPSAGRRFRPPQGPP
jgi:hypothetical protein